MMGDMNTSSIILAGEPFVMDSFEHAKASYVMQRLAIFQKVVANMYKQIDADYTAAEQDLAQGSSEQDLSVAAREGQKDIERGPVDLLSYHLMSSMASQKGITLEQVKALLGVDVTLGLEVFTKDNDPASIIKTRPYSAKEIAAHVKNNTYERNGQFCVVFEQQGLQYRATYLPWFNGLQAILENAGFNNSIEGDVGKGKLKISPVDYQTRALFNIGQNVAQNINDTVREPIEHLPINTDAKDSLQSDVEVYISQMLSEYQSRLMVLYEQIEQNPDCIPETRSSDRPPFALFNRRGNLEIYCGDVVGLHLTNLMAPQMIQLMTAQDGTQDTKAQRKALMQQLVKYCGIDVTSIDVDKPYTVSEENQRRKATYTHAELAKYNGKYSIDWARCVVFNKGQAIYLPAFRGLEKLLESLDITIQTDKVGRPAKIMKMEVGEIPADYQTRALFKICSNASMGAADTIFQSMSNNILEYSQSQEEHSLNDN